MRLKDGDIYIFIDVEEKEKQAERKEGDRARESKKVSDRGTKKLNLNIHRSKVVSETVNTSSYSTMLILSVSQ